MDEPLNNAVPSAPPPPAEVKVRTMRSDLESMAKSGGGLPRFQNVHVDGLSGGKIVSPVHITNNKALMIAIITAVALIAVGIVAYFAYTLLILHS